VRAPNCERLIHRYADETADLRDTRFRGNVNRLGNAWEPRLRAFGMSDMFHVEPSPTVR
jgi:hypothetical protein